jgi:hypothetical protein
MMQEDYLRRTYYAVSSSHMSLSNFPTLGKHIHEKSEAVREIFPSFPSVYLLQVSVIIVVLYLSDDENDNVDGSDN